MTVRFKKQIRFTPSTNELSNVDKNDSSFSGRFNQFVDRPEVDIGLRTAFPAYQAAKPAIKFGVKNISENPREYLRTGGQLLGNVVGARFGKPASAAGGTFGRGAAEAALQGYDVLRGGRFKPEEVAKQGAIGATGEAIGAMGGKAIEASKPYLFKGAKALMGSTLPIPKSFKNFGQKIIDKKMADMAERALQNEITGTRLGRVRKANTVKEGAIENVTNLANKSSQTGTADKAALNKLNALEKEYRDAKAFGAADKVSEMKSRFMENLTEPNINELPRGFEIPAGSEIKSSEIALVNKPRVIKGEYGLTPDEIKLGWQEQPYNVTSVNPETIKSPPYTETQIGVKPKQLTASEILSMKRGQNKFVRGKYGLTSPSGEVEARKDFQGAMGDVLHQMVPETKAQDELASAMIEMGGSLGRVPKNRMSSDWWRYPIELPRKLFGSNYFKSGTAQNIFRLAKSNPEILKSPAFKAWVSSLIDRTSE